MLESWPILSIPSVIWAINSAQMAWGPSNITRLITIFMLIYLKALNIWNACQVYSVDYVSYT